MKELVTSSKSTLFESFEFTVLSLPSGVPSLADGGVAAMYDAAAA